MIFTLRSSLIIFLFSLMIQMIQIITQIQHAHADDFAWGRTAQGVDLCFPAEDDRPIRGSQSVPDENCQPIFTWGQFTLGQRPDGTQILVLDSRAPWHCYFTNAATDRILSGRTPLADEEADEFCGLRQYTWAPTQDGEDKCYLAYTMPENRLRPLRLHPALEKEHEADTCGIQYEWGDEEGEQNWRCYAVNPKTKHALRAIQVDAETRRRTLRFRDPVPENCSRRKPKKHTATLFDIRVERHRDPDPIVSLTGGQMYFTWGMSRAGAEHCYQSTHSQRGDQHPYVNTSPVADEYCAARHLWGQDGNRQWHCYVTKNSGVPLHQRAPINNQYCPRSYMGQALQGIRGFLRALF